MSDGNVIRFYDANQPYYSLTNFCHSPIQYDNEIYRTAEHLFQAHKFFKTNHEVAREIRNCGRPREALELAGRNKHFVRQDWSDVNVRIVGRLDISSRKMKHKNLDAQMVKILFLKFTQHPTLLTELLSTEKKELIEASPFDSFWGEGQDGRGRNELGKALMRVRDELSKMGIWDEEGVTKASL